MAIEVFGVTYSTLEARFKRRLGIPGFSTSTHPAAADVTTEISRVSARVCDAIRRSGSTPAAIAAQTASEAYAYMQGLLQDGVGAWILSVAIAPDDPGAESLRARFEADLKALRDEGRGLADLYSATSNSGAPTCHLDYHGSFENTTIPDDRADAAPEFTMGDEP